MEKGTLLVSVITKLALKVNRPYCQKGPLLYTSTGWPLPADPEQRLLWGGSPEEAVEGKPAFHILSLPVRGVLRGEAHRQEGVNTQTVAYRNFQELWRLF